MSIFSYVKHFPPYHSPNRSGVIKAVHGFALGLAESGESVIILSEGEESATVQAQFGYNHYCFYNPQTAPSLKLSPSLKQFVQQQITKHDLVILNGGFHLSVYALARFLYQQGIPYVVAPHLAYDRAMFAKSPHHKYPYWYLCERWMLQHAKAIQVFDQTQAEWLIQRDIETPTIEIYNGFHPDEVLSLPSLEWRQHSSAKLMFFGRLSPHTKGLDLLLDAFSRPSESELHRAVMTLQGDDEGDRKRLQQQVKQLGLDTRVTFLDANYEMSPMVLMANHDIICLPSRSEGFGLAALEAMLAGRVLLVSEVSGIAQHVHASGCGVVVKPDAKSIHAGLQWLLECRADWPNMGMRGYDYAYANLSWDGIVQSAVNNYQRLIPEWEPTKQRLLTPLSI